MEASWEDSHQWEGQEMTVVGFAVVKIYIYCTNRQAVKERQLLTAVKEGSHSVAPNSGRMVLVLPLNEA